jgi:hypothetical protein
MIFRRLKSMQWRAVIVTEWWKADGGRGEIRDKRWLRALDGNSSDIKTWMRRCRSEKVKQRYGISAIQTLVFAKQLMSTIIAAINEKASM